MPGIEEKGGAETPERIERRGTSHAGAGPAPPRPGTRPAWRVFAAGAVLAVILLPVALPASGGEGDFFAVSGERLGRAVVDERTGRVDFYDVKSRHVGYGFLRLDGRVEAFRPDGRRLGRVWPGPPPLAGSRR